MECVLKCVLSFSRSCCSATHHPPLDHQPDERGRFQVNRNKGHNGDSGVFAVAQVAVSVSVC